MLGKGSAFIRLSVYLRQGLSKLPRLALNLESSCLKTGSEFGVLLSQSPKQQTLKACATRPGCWYIYFKIFYPFCYYQRNCFIFTQIFLLDQRGQWRVEKAQWEICLLFKLKALSLDPQNPYKAGCIIPTLLWQDGKWRQNLKAWESGSFAAHSS